jgi:1-acyl-sn-glycerol-3-phosphate acyltransferase
MGVSRTFEALGSGSLLLVRTLFFYIFGVFWIGLIAFVFSMPVALVERLLGRKEPVLALAIFHRGIWATSFPYRLATEVTLDARARVAQGTAVVIGNHHSFIDIWLMLHLFPFIHYSAKPSLFRIPFLGWGMALLGHFRHDPACPERALAEAVAWVRRGRYVGMFPEGTRNPTDAIGRFHRGAFLLAQQTTERVQPVVVAGTQRVWTRGQFWIRQLGPIHMKVLPAVEVPARLERQELRELIDRIHATMAEEHERLERGLAGG